MQDADESLEVARQLADESPQSTPRSFFRKDGLLYRRWKPSKQGEEGDINELVLPSGCRKKVLELSHSVPFARHLGQKKTTRRIAQRFYWPTLSWDVADFCRSCEKCQKFRHHKIPRAPMYHFRWLLNHSPGLQWTLWDCYPGVDPGIVTCWWFATMEHSRYPQAVPVRTIDAVTVAEELMKLFSSGDPM